MAQRRKALDALLGRYSFSPCSRELEGAVEGGRWSEGEKLGDHGGIAQIHGLHRQRASCPSMESMERDIDRILFIAPARLLTL